MATIRVFVVFGPVQYTQNLFGPALHLLQYTILITKISVILYCKVLQYKKITPRFLTKYSDDKTPRPHR